MALETKGHIKIISNGDPITFKPASLRVSFESVAGANSGRTEDGTMKINWKARKIPKLEIGLPPFSLDDPMYYGILSLVQGQEYTVEYFDPMLRDWTSDQFYTSNTQNDFYSGVILNGMIQNASFNAIGMNSHYKTSDTNPIPPIPPHKLAPKLPAPNISIAGTTVSWSAVTNADHYIIDDNGNNYSQTTRTYTVTNTGIVHTIKVKSLGAGYTESNWSNSVTYTPQQLSAPVISLNDETITWSAVAHATNYIVSDNGVETTQAGLSYTISDNTIIHTLKVKATGTGYLTSNWSNTVSFTPAVGEYWTIHWNNIISTYGEDEGNITWDVRYDTIPVNFISNNTNYSSIYAGGAEEFLSYDNESVYGYDHEPDEWYDSNYQDIIMYEDPETVFYDYWANFLEENGTITHHT